MHWRNILILLTFSLLVFIPGISSIPPLDRDESRFAQASKQMIETGDYVDIRFQETPRYKKPVGAYWVQAATVNILSPDNLNSIWAYRIPSLLASLAAVILTYAIACLFVKREVALFSGILLASSFLINAEAHMAKTDALLLLSVLITQYGLARTYKGDISFLSWLYFWAGLGLSILLKGPIVPVIILLAIVTLCCFDRNLSLIKQLRPMTGVLVATAISLPWVIAVQISSSGVFLKKSIGVDLLPKLMGGVESHGMPPGYYLLMLMIAFWPSSLFLWPSLIHFIKAKKDVFFKFIIAWVVPAWIMLEIVPTKLPHYVLPLYPAIAITVAKAMDETNFYKISLGSKLYSGLWFILSSGLIIASIFLANPNIELVASPGHEIDKKIVFEHIQNISNQQALLTFTLILISLAAVIFLWKGKIKTCILSIACCAVLFFIPLTHSKIPAIKWAFPSAEIADFLEATNRQDNKLISIGYHEPSLVFLNGTDTYLANINDGVKKLKDEPKSLVLISHSKLEDFYLATTQAGLTTKLIETFNSFNYSKGRSLVLNLLVVTNAQN